jgi:N-acetylglucosamine kinase-like BadF-type ATPase
VTEAATDRGDPVAARICQEAGAALAESLLVAAAGREQPHLVATGGLLASEPITAALDERLAAAGHQRGLARGTALDGG